MKRNQFQRYTPKTQKIKGVFNVTNRKNTWLKLTACLALVMTMIFSMTLPAFAADYTTGTDAANPAEAAITKVFKMPVNTSTPAAVFTFQFTAVGMDDSTDPTGMPPIPDKTVTFTAGEEPALPVGATLVNGDVKSVVKETEDILYGFTSDSWTKGAGIYKYTVHELDSGITITDPAKEDKTYSTAIYDIEIWVEKDTNGDLYAKYFSAKIVDGFRDEYYEGTPGTEKVDPTPGGHNRFPETTIEDNFSQLIFTNKYWKTSGGGVTEPDKTALEIIKKVTGNGADLTKYFDFDVTVIQPSVIQPATPAKVYKAYVLNAAGAIVTDTTPAAKNGTISGTETNGDGYFLFTSEVSKLVKLMDGQRLAFVDLHVGSTVVAEEAAATGYQPKYERTFSTLGEFTGEEGKPWGFPWTPDDEGPHCTIDGQNANTATFTNTRTNATPTGISVDNLPYIVLIGMAAACLIGIVGFGFHRSVKRDARVK